MASTIDIANTSRFFIGGKYLLTSEQLDAERVTVGFHYLPPSPRKTFLVYELHEHHFATPCNAKSQVIEVREPGGFTYGPDYWSLKQYTDRGGLQLHIRKRLMQDCEDGTISIGEIGHGVDDTDTKALQPLTTRWVRPLFEFEGCLVHRTAVAPCRVGMDVISVEKMQTEPPAFFSLPDVSENMAHLSYLSFASRFFPEILHSLATEVFGRACVVKNPHGWGEENEVLDKDYRFMMAKRCMVGLTCEEARRMYVAMKFKLGVSPHREFISKHVKLQGSQYTIQYRGIEDGGFEYSRPELTKARWTWAMMAHCWETELIEAEVTRSGVCGARVIADCIVDRTTWHAAWTELSDNNLKNKSA